MPRRASLFPWPGDLLAFFLPAIAGVLCGLWAGNITYAPKSPYLPLTILFIWLTDSGHVFATLFLVAFNGKYRRALGHQLWSAPLIVMLSIVVVAACSPELFPVFIGYIALSHILLQHFGWMRLIERQEQLPNWGRRVDLALFSGLVGLPIYFWHTGQSSVQLSYFMQDNLILRVPESPWPIINCLYLVIVAAAIIWNFWLFIERSKTSLSRIPFFLITVFWWYGGLVIAPVDAIFWICLITCHGWSYLLHTSSAGAPHWQKSWPLLALLLAAIVINGAWWSNLRSAWTQPGVSPWFLLIVWMPLFLHYTFDSIIWKKKFQAKLNAA